MSAKPCPGMKMMYLLSIVGTDWVGTLTASIFGLMGHHVPSSWNLISSTSEQSFRISKNKLSERKTLKSSQKFAITFKKHVSHFQGFRDQFFWDIQKHSGILVQKIFFIGLLKMWPKYKYNNSNVGFNVPWQFLPPLGAFHGHDRISQVQLNLLALRCRVWSKGFFLARQPHDLCWCKTHF